MLQSCPKRPQELVSMLPSRCDTYVLACVTLDTEGCVYSRKYDRYLS